MQPFRRKCSAVIDADCISASDSKFMHTHILPQPRLQHVIAATEQAFRKASSVHFSSCRSAPSLIAIVCTSVVIRSLYVDTGSSDHSTQAALLVYRASKQVQDAFVCIIAEKINHTLQVISPCRRID